MGVPTEAGQEVSFSEAENEELRRGAMMIRNMPLGGAAKRRSMQR